MGLFKQRLSKIESQLQSIIEGSAARLFPSRQSTSELASRLVEAMHAGLSQDTGTHPVAPNLYILYVHPEEADFFRGNPMLLADLTRVLREASLDAGFSFAASPVVRIEADPELTLGSVRVVAQNSQNDLPQTSILVVESDKVIEDLPKEAFLIVDGMRVFQLRQAVLNIGRRADNDLVLEDNRVSRLHAQLRWVRGAYVIIDLDSAGGTRVNGEAITQRALRPGDVISLSGVPIVFGLEETPENQTRDYYPHQE